MALDPDYQLFDRVAHHGSISAAGRALGLSPAMASKRLARLERRLGAQLVRRTTRRLALTPAGERFHADVAAILAAVAEAEARVTGLARAPSGALRVSAPTSFGRLHVAPLLHRFLAAHPAIALTLDLTDAFVDLLAEPVDVAVRIAARVPAGLVAHRLAASRRVLCATPGYLAQAGIPDSVAELAQHRLLAAHGQMPWRLVRNGRAVTIDRPSHVDTNSSELVRELTLTGVGIALRSLWDVGDALRDGTITRVLPEWEGSTDVGVYAVHAPASPPSPAIAAFVAFLTDAFADCPWDRQVDPPGG